MQIAQDLESLRDYLELNEDQRSIVTHDSGPLLVIAGPGSGKTRSLSLLAMNLLLLKKAKPSELILCTYTEKAAHEMQDRICEIATKVNYKIDISQMRIGTIHSICNNLIMENLHYVENIGNNYETIDELQQRLLIFEWMDMICKPDATFFMNRWRTTRWKTAKKLQNFFDKITEELINIKSFYVIQDHFLHNLANTYRAYQKVLVDCNRVDFAHLQKIVYGLLRNPNISQHLTKGISYVLVDEYQDTNYIQEQILIKLASATRNICVVGDEDQSLYRFRGATVQNIHEFRDNFPECKQIYLTMNYRSHPKIINVYNRWIASISWNHAGQPFRYDKTIQPIPDKIYPEYPATLSISGKDVYEEAELFAEFVTFLKEQGIIIDFNQVALLLYSVKIYKSDVYVQALEKKGIPVFCPRAGKYFVQDEVCLIVGCFTRIFGYHNQGRGNFIEYEPISAYVNECFTTLANWCQSSKSLNVTLQELEAEIMHLEEGQKLDKQLADYFYRLLATEPFATFVKDENRMRNLVIFSQLLNTFQNYYRYNHIDNNNLEQLRSHLFNSFLGHLYDDGVNQYENPEQPFPEGYVQILTIHQAKGLEFPVVVVGNLDRQPSDSDEVDRRLQRFYHRKQFEPEHLIPSFDFMRLYYVAFSRAMNLLVLTMNQHKKPNPLFNSIRQDLPQWSSPQSILLNITGFQSKSLTIAKRRYSYTGHIQIYETCPRQYQFFREYKFIPSRIANTFFGLLVHQTIEMIHRIVIDGHFAILTESKLRELFERTNFFLSGTNMPSIDANEKEKAFIQVMNYFLQNQSEMQRVIKTEEKISVVKDGYILTGKFDLLMQVNGNLELLDFKASKRPNGDSEHLDSYERQLYMYAHALEQRDGIRPERLLLYWTEEARKEDALMVFPYRPKLVEKVVFQFDAVVNKIKANDFCVAVPPGREVCRACDIRTLCISENLIDPC